MKFSKELKAGIIAIITIALFWWMFQFLKGKDVFTRGNIYHIEYENVDGLEPTKPVTINGLRVGRVEKISPITDGKGKYTFDVKIMVDDDFPINKGTIAEIYEPGIMAGKQIRLIPSENTKMVNSGEKIEGRLNASITEVLSNEVTPLKDNINRVLLELDSTLNITQKVLAQTSNGQLAVTLNHTNDALRSVKNTSNSANNLIEANKQELNTLLKEANGMMATLGETASDFSGVARKYGEVADKLNQLEVEETIAQLQNTLDEFNKFTTKLNSNEGTLGKLMSDEELYNNITQTSENLNKLVTDLKENPKRYVNVSVFGRKEKE